LDDKNIVKHVNDEVALDMREFFVGAGVGAIMRTGGHSAGFARRLQARKEGIKANPNAYEIDDRITFISEEAKKEAEATIDEKPTPEEPAAPEVPAAPKVTPEQYWDPKTSQEERDQAWEAMTPEEKNDVIEAIPETEEEIVPEEAEIIPEIPPVAKAPEAPPTPPVTKPVEKPVEKPAPPAPADQGIMEQIEEQDLDDNASVQVLDETYRKYASRQRGVELDPGAISISEDSEVKGFKKLQRSMIRSAAKAFDRDVVFVKFDPKVPDPFTGITFAKTKIGKKIFINAADVKKGMMPIIGHELTHTLRTTDEKSLDEMIDFVTGQATAAGLKQIETIKQREIDAGRQEDIADRLAKEEYLANFIGDNFAGKQWNQIAKQSPNLFIKVGAKVMEIIDKVLAYITNQGFQKRAEWQSQINNLNAAKKRIQPLLTNARRVVEGKPGKLKEPAFSRVQGNVPEQRQKNLDSFLKESQVKNIVYHGTIEGFTEFKKGDIGFHFGSIEQAENRLKDLGDWIKFPKGSNVVPVYLSLKNPYNVVSDLGQWNDMESLEEYFGPANEGPFSAKEWAKIKNVQGFVKGMKAKGYDGIVYDNAFEAAEGQSFIAFDSNQVKSATGNLGKYSPEESDIRFIRKEDLIKPKEPKVVPPTPKGMLEFERKRDIEAAKIKKEKVDEFPFKEITPEEIKRLGEKKKAEAEKEKKKRAEFPFKETPEQKALREGKLPFPTLVRKKPIPDTEMKALKARLTAMEAIGRKAPTDKQIQAKITKLANQIEKLKRVEIKKPEKIITRKPTIKQQIKYAIMPSKGEELKNLNQRLLMEEIAAKEGVKSYKSQLQSISLSMDKLRIAERAAERQRLRMVISDKQSKVADVKRQVMNYMTARKLDPKDRAKILSRIRPITTVVPLRRVIDMIDIVEGKSRKSAAITALKKVVKKANIKKMRPEFANTISGILDGLSLVTPTRKTISKLESLKKHIESDPDHMVPDGQLARLSLLSKTPVADMKVEDVEEITNSVKQLIALNKLKNKLIMKGRYMDFFKARDQAVENLKKTGDMQWVAFNEDGSKAKIFKEFAKAEGYARPKGWSVARRDEAFDLGTYTKSRDANGLVRFFTTQSYNAELVTEILDGFRESYNEMDPKDMVRQVFYEGINDGHNKTLAFRQGAEDYFAQTLRGLDTTKMSRHFHPTAKKQRKFVDTRRIYLPSLKKHVTFAPGEVISLYLHTLNEQNLDHLLKGGFAFPGNNKMIFKIDGGDLQAITKTLTKEEKQVASVVHNFFNDIQQKAINEASVELNGFELATVENYFPIRANPVTIKRDELKMKHTPASMQSFNVNSLEAMGMLQERKGAKNGIILDDVFYALANSIRGSSSYIGLAKPLRNAKMLLRDQKFQTQVTFRHGKHYIDYLHGYLQDLEGRSFRAEHIDNLLRGLKNNFVIAKLGLNPWVIMKQPISYMGALTELDAKHWVKGAIKGAPLEEMVKWSSRMRARFEGAMNKEMGEMMASVEARKLVNADDRTFRDKMISTVMAGIGKFDFLAVSRIWNAAKSEVKEKVPNISNDELMRLTAKRTEEIVRLTQPTFDIIDRSEIGRSTSVLMNGITMFTSQRNKNVMIIRRAMERYKRTERMAADKARLVGDASIVFLIQGLLLYLVDRGRDLMFGRFGELDDDDEEYTLVDELGYIADKIVSTAIGNYYVVGDLWKNLKDKMQKKPWGKRDPLNVPGFQITGELLQTGANIKNLITDKVFQEETKRESAMTKKEKVKFKQQKQKYDERWEKNFWYTMDRLASMAGSATGVPYDSPKNLIVKPIQAHLIKETREMEKMSKWMNSDDAVNAAKFFEWYTKSPSNQGKIQKYMDKEKGLVPNVFRQRRTAAKRKARKGLDDQFRLGEISVSEYNRYKRHVK